MNCPKCNAPMPAECKILRLVRLSTSTKRRKTSRRQLRKLDSRIPIFSNRRRIIQIRIRQTKRFNFDRDGSRAGTRLHLGNTISGRVCAGDRQSAGGTSNLGGSRRDGFDVVEYGFAFGVERRSFRRAKTRRRRRIGFCFDIYGQRRRGRGYICARRARRCGRDRDEIIRLLWCSRVRIWRAILALQVDTKFGGAKSWLGGEGLFLAAGYPAAGLLLVSSFGAIHRKTLRPGEQYVVDTGHLVAWEGQMQYNLRKAAKSGFFRSFLSGEGIGRRIFGTGRNSDPNRNLRGICRTSETLLSRRRAAEAAADLILM